MKRLIFCGHSSAARRQTLFFDYINSLGYEVKTLVPNFGTRIRGFQDIIDEFDPDVVYCQDELDGLTFQIIQLKGDFKRVLFSWQNLDSQQKLSNNLLKSYDKLIAGCPGAFKLLKSRELKNVHYEFIPQVGIDDDLFRPLDFEKEFDTCTSAGFTVNKGVGEIEEIVEELELKHLWLGKRRRFDIVPHEGFPRYGHWPEYMEYEKLPIWYNKAGLHLLASRDTPAWIEQFTYSLGESLAVGLYNVVTDAGDWPEIWKEAPGLEMIPQGDRLGFKDAVRRQLMKEESNNEGREWLIRNYGKRIIAKRLIEALENV